MVLTRTGKGKDISKMTDPQVIEELREQIARLSAAQTRNLLTIAEPIKITLEQYYMDVEQFGAVWSIFVSNQKFAALRRRPGSRSPGKDIVNLAVETWLRFRRTRNTDPKASQRANATTPCTEHQ
ncbi:hypothetical protein TSAR_000831 [Trichomalopsis sarcophagae]|uniref:Uncharacterized protein n=1 Tax=Trichomalopsis sarcophagae TaxID=543379 RepID=A0A232EJ75_9HYME|nr:hypothetical protein TSAR_000831 [Trichomalopsis sarcophagae]